MPTALVTAFLILGAITHGLDRSRPAILEPGRNLPSSHFFSSPQATQSLLATVASGIITITAITISLLLIALRQSAGSMTAQVFDQYIRRWFNLAYFGYFVGLSLFSLVDPCNRRCTV